MRYMLLQIEHPNRMNLDKFCEMYDIGIGVTEQAPKPFRFLAVFTEINYHLEFACGFAGDRGGPGDRFCGGGDTPEGAVQDLVTKVTGRFVTATRSGRRVEIPQLALCELAPSQPERARASSQLTRRSGRAAWAKRNGFDPNDC